MRAFPTTRFAAIVDNTNSILAIAQAAQAERTVVELLLDLDCGMGRTGVACGPAAFECYRLISSLPELAAGGLHAYDGHICDSDPEVRKKAAQVALAPVATLARQLEHSGFHVPRIVVGGTPTFPAHVAVPGFECSPGTCILWDAGYAAMLPDLDFAPAALVLTRVVSKPGTNRLCLDLGHKAIASEGPHPRVHLFGLSDAVPVMHNEEHLVLESPRAKEIRIGDAIYGIPWHICPTVALNAFATMVRCGRAETSWKITARDRMLTI
jgi:D-serine deaminase-like pyridoxal phosphate-dependent protein